METERKYLLDGINQGIRVDGRGLTDRRYVVRMGFAAKL